MVYWAVQLVIAWCLCHSGVSMVILSVIGGRCVERGSLEAHVIEVLDACSRVMLLDENGVSDVDQWGDDVFQHWE
ncbi:MAG TPA: hypothetical protein ACQGQI_01355 [Xylella sp.]